MLLDCFWNMDGIRNGDLVQEQRILGRVKGCVRLKLKSADLRLTLHSPLMQMSRESAWQRVPSMTAGERSV